MNIKEYLKPPPSKRHNGCMRRRTYLESFVHFPPPPQKKNSNSFFHGWFRGKKVVDAFWARTKIIVQSKVLLFLQPNIFTASKKHQLNDESTPISRPNLPTKIAGWRLVGNEGLNPHYNHVKLHSFVPY